MTDIINRTVCYTDLDKVNLHNKVMAVWLEPLFATTTPVAYIIMTLNSIVTQK
jgi:hypothetical protein